MRNYLMTAVTLLLICSFIINAQSLDPVAVIDFSGEGISATTLVAMSDYFRTELIGTGKFDVMDRNNVDGILKEQGFQMSGACTDVACMVEVGQMLGVSKMFGGTIGKLGTKYLITVKIIDVSTGRIDQSITEKFLGAVEDLDQPISSLALKIAGDEEAGTGGKFYVTSEPSGAMVYLDNNFQGNSPITISVDEIREYVIKAELSGYNPWQQNVSAKKDETVGINAVLARFTGSVTQSQDFKYGIPDPIAYKREKKDAKTAAILSLVPGLGHFYSKQYVFGSAFAVVRGGMFVMMGMSGNIIASDVDIYMVLLTTGLDIGAAYYSTLSYNNKLRQKYNITMHPMIDREQNCQMALTIDF